MLSYPEEPVWPAARLSATTFRPAAVPVLPDHLKVAAGSIIGGGQAFLSSIEKPDYYAGYMPAMPHREFYNILSVIKRLPEMRRQLKHLAEKVDSLKKE